MGHFVKKNIKTHLESNGRFDELLTFKIFMDMFSFNAGQVSDVVVHPFINLDPTNPINVRFTLHYSTLRENHPSITVTTA